MAPDSSRFSLEAFTTFYRSQHRSRMVPAASTQDLSILVHPLTPNAVSAPSPLVKLFVETFQAQLTGNIFRLLRADTKADLEEAIKAADAGAKVLNDFVKVNGSSEGGSFFLGSKYSYAETMTTPFVLRALLLKDYKKYDLVGRAKEHGLDRLAAWIEASLSRPSAKTSSPSHEALVETMAGYNQPLKD
ncbi:hypothetical protein WJX84_009116 [Apatococcus fuscideae]|uniref:Glutathione S-transferase n=1 Tax=Apatococcus fuscideae TaxID=2026836 RepID=A0AAW1T970_9CHLO